MIAMMQCPLHIYSIFALRASNERFLGDGGSEQEWGFGQIAAVILLGGNILHFVDGIAGASLSRSRDDKKETNSGLKNIEKYREPRKSVMRNSRQAVRSL
jgi:hypothetical protein